MPSGYDWNTIVRWGDPLFWNSPAFDPTRPSASAQELQFGYNNDYLDILVQDRRGRRALLCLQSRICEPQHHVPAAGGRGRTRGAQDDDRRSRAERGGTGAQRPRPAVALHPWCAEEPPDHRGHAVPADRPGGRQRARQDRRGPGRHHYQRDLRQLLRRHHPMGHHPVGRRELQRLLPRQPERGGQQTVRAEHPELGREHLPVGEGRSALRRHQSRLRERAEPVRLHRRDRPQDPTSTPRKHSAMGRFKHEGANVRVDRNGTVVAYMGDDERFDYLYKFVARRKFTPGSSARARRRNLGLLEQGDLYVAKFSGEEKPDLANLGRGEWRASTRNGQSVVPGFTTEEVLVFTRLAADALEATPMDRPEDVEPNLKTGKVYVACTNNTDRGKADDPATTPHVDDSLTDAANPRKPNKDGHVIEITERGNRGDATTFAWNLFLVCGDPANTTGIKTYFGGYPNVMLISCPDNVAFDSTGNNLWVATDGQPGTISKADGLFKVGLTGANRGKVEQFLAVPRGRKPAAR